MLPIPAIDLIDGKCVRLNKGNYDRKTVYRDNPADVAREFQDHGFTRLHLVDLDGARAGHVVNFRVLEQIATATSLIVDFGGGLKTTDDVASVFNAGAQMITIGSIAVQQPQRVNQWAERYGHDRIIIGADALNGTIRISGWEAESGLPLSDFVKSYYDKGFRRVLCTDISRDGMLSGPAIALYQDLLRQFPDLKLIASGGVSSIDDLYALRDAQIPEVVFGKAIYEGRISLPQVVKEFIG